MLLTCNVLWEDAVQYLNLIAKYYVEWTWAIDCNSRLPADHGTAVCILESQGPQVVARDLS